MRIKQLINPDIQPLNPTEAIVQAVETMSSSGRHVLPVVGSDGKLAGILRTRDVLPILLGRSTRGRQVRHFMARRFVTFRADDEVTDACNTWLGGAMDDLVVIDADRVFVGIVEPSSVLAMIPRLRRVA
ncbi:MAG: CBS domain-containing protein [Nannocystaceae bacterium]|nr:CBS domain-containing protein [Nannocystaceae bacterium]